MKTTRREIRHQINTLFQAASEALAIAGLHHWSENMTGGAPDLLGARAAAERLAKHGVEERIEPAKAAVKALDACEAALRECALDHLRQVTGIEPNVLPTRKGGLAFEPIEPPAIVFWDT